MGRGFDCALIPDAMSVGGMDLQAPAFCGSGKGLATKGTRTANTKMALDGSLDKTVCCAWPLHLLILHYNLYT